MKKEEKELINFLQTELSKTLELKNDTLICYSKEINVREISDALRIPSSLIISFFWKLGKVITKNQSLSFDLIEKYCKSRGIKIILSERIETNKIIGKYLANISNRNEDKISRVPIVSVMGHIDHGKSTLLDTIRVKQDQKKEEGGITQKINIYPIEFKEKKIIFLDTPGHNVFLKMRERGASFTDLVVLVIASEDGVMPQTVEVINYIHKYKIPTIAFINNKKKEKINDKNLEKIKSQLDENGIVPTDWDGETTVISGNALNKEDTNNLLENILVLSEIYNWKANINSSANGIVLDSYTSNREGIVNTILIKNGSLKNRENIFLNGNSGKVKKIVDFVGNEIQNARPGEIVQVFGLGFESDPGDFFLVINDERLVKKIKRIVPFKRESNKFSQSSSPSNDSISDRQDKKVINLIIIADSQSSLESLENIIKNRSLNNLILNIIYSESGDINDSIISLSKITQSAIFFFNTKINQKKIKELKDNGIKWFSSSVIYKLEEGLAEIIDSYKEKRKIEKILGIAEITKIFYFSEIGNIAGCQVLSGTINRNHLINVFRKEEMIFSGKIRSLQRDKSNIKEINKGQECGIVINNFNDFILGDKIVSYSLIDEDNNA